MLKEYSGHASTREPDSAGKQEAQKKDLKRIRGLEVGRGVGGFNCIPEVSLAALRWCHKRPVESRAGTAGFLFDPQTLSSYCTRANCDGEILQ